MRMINNPSLTGHGKSNTHTHKPPGDTRQDTHFGPEGHFSIFESVGRRALETVPLWSFSETGYHQKQTPEREREREREKRESESVIYHALQKVDWNARVVMTLPFRLLLCVV